MKTELLLLRQETLSLLKYLVIGEATSVCTSDESELSDRFVQCSFLKVCEVKMLKHEKNSTVFMF